MFYSRGNFKNERGKRDKDERVESECGRLSVLKLNFIFPQICNGNIRANLIQSSVIGLDRPAGATVARSTPDRKVIRSNRVRVIFPLGLRFLAKSQLEEKSQIR